MPGLSNKGRGYGSRPPFLSVFVVIGSPAKGVKPHRGQDDSLEHSLNETVVVLSLSLAPAITARYDPTFPGTTVEEPAPQPTEGSIALVVSTAIVVAGYWASHWPHSIVAAAFGP